MEEGDVFIMLPGKVGPARKLINLVKETKTKNLNKEVTVNSVWGQQQLLPVDDLKRMHSDCDTLIIVEDRPATSVENLQQVPTSITEIQNAPDESPKICCSPVQSNSASKTSISIPLEQYVPEFSMSIKKLLQEGEIYKEFDKFIEETAYHVLAIGEFTSRGIYQDFGRLMVQKYPCVAHNAMKEPWGYFNTRLSRKVRNIRWKWGVRSRKPSLEEPKTKNMKKSSKDFVEMDESSLMPSGEAMKILREELKKPSKEQDKPLMLKAQKSTFRERRVSIENASSIKEIFEKWEILQKIMFIEREFFLLRTETKAEDLTKSWKTILSKLDIIFDAPKDMDNERTDEDVLGCLQLLMDQLKYNAKSKAIQPLISKCKATELSLVTKKSEAPRLVVVVMDDNKICNCYVVGEGLQVDVGADIKNAINRLLFCYYTWDLSYPKQYQTLGFLQTYLLCDTNNKFQMSANYMKFTKKFEDVVV